MHFVIYEAIKARLIAARVGLNESEDNTKTSKDFLEFMMAGAISKTVASSIAYPHGNALTIAIRYTFVSTNNLMQTFPKCNENKKIYLFTFTKNRKHDVNYF